MPEVTLRLATLADLPLVRAWDKDADVWASDPHEEDDAWNWEVELGRTPPWREQLVAEMDGRPIGFVQIIDPAAEETHYWGATARPTERAIDIWIGRAEDRNRGYGTQMMRLALARCFAEPHVAAVLLDPLASNTAALRFYARLGFVDTGERWFGDECCRVLQLSRTDWEASANAAPTPERGG